MNKSHQKERAIKVVHRILKRYETGWKFDLIDKETNIEAVSKHIIKNLRRNNIIPRWKY